MITSDFLVILIGILTYFKTNTLYQNKFNVSYTGCKINIRQCVTEPWGAYRFRVELSDSVHDDHLK